MDPIPSPARVGLSGSMPLTLARLRRTLGRSLSVGGGGQRPRGGVGGTQHVELHVELPMTVRGPTADGEDVRLLVEVLLDGGPSAPAEPERVAHALLLAAARRWLAEHDLAELRDALPSARDSMEAAVRDEFDELDLRLLRFDVESVEHLIASRSADPEELPEHPHDVEAGEPPREGGAR